MRKGVVAAAGSGCLAAIVAFSAAPAQAVPISAPAALKGAGDAVNLTDQVCWGGCGYGYYGPPRYYPRPYYGYGYGYRPYGYGYGYRPYGYGYGYRPYGYGYGYRPYGYGYGYRPYGYGYGPAYYRPVPPWVSGPYYY